MGTLKETPILHGNFGCFTLPQPPIEIFVSDIGSDGLPTRQRKSHGKSRYGCRNCKERKVKCDEKQPCGHCVKRKRECSLAYAVRESLEKNPSSTKISRSTLKRKRPEETEARSWVNQQISPIHLPHLQLLHHFENHTYETFIFEPQVWKDTVIPLALEHTFLMQAVFLVTAAHLQYIHPHNNRYRAVVFEYLSQALPGFRIALDTLPGTTPKAGDAIMSCSLLLLNYSWAASIPDGTGDNDGWDSLLGLYTGLRRIVFSFWELKNGGSRFSPSLIYSPRISIERFLEGQQVPADIEECFGHVISCSKISDDQLGLSECLAAAQRLTTIWSALKLGMPALEASSIYLDVARYLFTWPNLQPTGFSDLINNNHRRCQVILLYYFAAVVRFRSNRFWWMRRRAIYMFESIFDKLKDNCEVCTGMAKALRDEDDMWL